MIRVETNTQRTTLDLDARACRDDEVLRAFVEENVSVNAWPILSRPLRRQIRRQGLDLAAARDFDPPPELLEGLMRRFYAGSRRVERMLGIDNAFHNTLHNFDVALRLLLLEWPPQHPIAEEMRQAAAVAYTSFDDLSSVLVELMGRLRKMGVPAAHLARDLLAAAGHDYGHTGGGDRKKENGDHSELTHEDAAEKHAAKFGIDAGMPPALILESMAGIRVTVLHVRPGREKIFATSEFERKMMLADVAGCVKRPDLWMTRVAIPVVIERLEPWRHVVTTLPEKIRDMRRRLDEMADRDDGRPELAKRLAKAEAQNATIIRTVTQAIDNERRFLTFIRDHRLAPVAAGRRLWAKTIDDRIHLVERQLARKDLLEPLDARGFSFVEEMAHQMANVDSLERLLADEGLPAELSELYLEFLPAPTR